MERQENQKMQATVADSRKCPLQILAEMAESDNPLLRMSAALNPYTNKVLLKKLCSDVDPNVRYLAASSSYLPIEWLWQLKNDDDANVRWRAEVTLVKLGIIRQVS